MVSYLKLTKKEILGRFEKLSGLLNPCRICPRECKVNRQVKNPKLTGFCKMGREVHICGIHPHFGEEKVLVGKGGSGTIFFTSCNLACVYCQNWEISQARAGEKISIKKLAGAMIRLQNLGCHNINFVSPTIWVAQIVEALLLAIDMGLSIPLVYNTGGYDRVETLELLDGIVDIYMPDIKYSDDEIGKKYSLVDNYWQVAKKAIRQMHRQVGDLKVSDNGIAQKGLLVRHLVLPNSLSGTEKAMKFLAGLSKNTFVNIMDQYYPTHKAYSYPELNRRITRSEYQTAIESAKKAGLTRFAV